MKPSPISKLILFPLLALVVAQFACSLGTQPPSTAPQQPDASLPAPSDSATSAPENSNADQIIISGAVSKTYTPTKIEANNIMGRIVINLIEKNANGIFISFPADTQPGTYTMVYYLDDPAGGVTGQYQAFSGGDAITYNSTKGTLTLTTVSPTFSGQFQFTAVDNKDASKTISVSGSFTDVPVNP
jgi:hypothetical protein